MQQHHIRPHGMPPTNGYSHAVAFTGAMVMISGQVPARPPASSLVQVSGLVHPAFRIEIEAIACLPGA